MWLCSRNTNKQEEKRKKSYVHIIGSMDWMHAQMDRWMTKMRAHTHKKKRKDEQKQIVSILFGDWWFERGCRLNDIKSHYIAINLYYTKKKQRININWTQPGQWILDKNLTKIRHNENQTHLLNWLGKKQKFRKPEAVIIISDLLHVDSIFKSICYSK